jgi:hypothetical protein
MLGIRPEEMFVEPAEKVGEEGSVAGVIRLIEPSGTAAWVTVDLRGQDGSTTVIGTAMHGFVPKIRDSVAVVVRQATLHLFDPATGQRFGSA